MRASVSPGGSATGFVDRGAAPVGKTHIQKPLFRGPFREQENKRRTRLKTLTQHLHANCKLKCYQML